MAENPRTRALSVVPGRSSRAEWIAMARNAIEAATRAADEGDGDRALWIVVTSSFRVPIDPTVERDAAAIDAISRGEALSVVAGLTPMHTEVGFRYALEGKNPREPEAGSPR